MNKYFKNFCIKFRSGLVRAGYHSKPSFLIIGAQKAGTVALHNYLSKHPNIIPGTKKEIYFFNSEFISYMPEGSNNTMFRNNVNDYLNLKVNTKGTAWYHNHFPLPHQLGRHGITFEASPGYLYYPGSAKRIFSYNRQMKLIALLRDPVDRAFSGWNMFRNFGGNPANPYYHLAESREFDESVRDEIDKILCGNPTLEPSFVSRGLYHEQLLRYFKYFKPDQILIIDSRLFKSNTALILSEITQFLCLPKYDWHQTELPLLHVGKYEKQLPEKTRTLLCEFYKPYNEKLYKLIDRNFNWQ